MFQETDKILSYLIKNRIEITEEKEKGENERENERT
jgi:hypothetical protein